MAGMNRLAQLGKQVRARILYYRALYADPLTPFRSRALLWLAIAYAALPFDLIPDFIPVVGHLDDLVIVPGLILLAMRWVPSEVKRAHKHMLTG